MPATECFVFETLTGMVRAILPCTALSWNTPLGSGGKVEATVSLTDAASLGLNVRELSTGWKYGLAAVYRDRWCLAAGILDGTRPWDTDNPNELKLSAPEPWELLARRYLLGSYQPGPLTDLTLTSATLPGLAVEIAQTALNQVPGGGLPILLPDREPGSERTRTYEGTNLKDAKAALDDLSKVENGPDICFDAEFDDINHRVQWRMRVGRPKLGQAGTPRVFDFPGQGVTKATEDEDASGLATTMLVTSQPQSDTEGEGGGEQVNMVARHDNPELLERGYPALWGHNGDHTDVNQQATLDAYARSYGLAAAVPITERPLTVRADHPEHPVESYGRGDRIQLQVGRGHPWLPAGMHQARVAERSGDLSQDVQLTLTPDDGT